MRRNPFDQFAKDCLELWLEDAGEVKRSLEVSVPSQLLDAVFTPSVKGLAKLRRRGLLGRLASQRCAWECFHDAPSLDDLRVLVRKHLGWHTRLTARARRKKRHAVVPLPPLYVVCAQRPSAALAVCAAPMETYGAGFYAVAFGLLGLCVVVVDELPKTRSTLTLRLLGREGTLDAALDEVAALPPDAWEHRIRQAMVDFAARRADGAWSKDMEGIHERYAKIEKRLIERGERKGIRKGGAASLALVAEVRLGRRLKSPERATLLLKVSSLGLARATRVLMNREPDALVTWLAGG